MVQHQVSLSQVGGQSSVQGAAGLDSRFLAQGRTHVMRCAKLLSYLMIEYEVPMVVRHAVRCARLFFFGLVDFHKLEPYRLSSLEIVEPNKEEEQTESGQQVKMQKPER